MHFVHFDDLNFVGTPQFIELFSECFNPLIDRNMADLQEPPDRAESKSFEVKFNRLTFEFWVFSALLNRMAILAVAAAPSLFSSAGPNQTTTLRA